MIFVKNAFVLKSETNTAGFNQPRVLMVVNGRRKNGFEGRPLLSAAPKEKSKGQEPEAGKEKQKKNGNDYPSMRVPRQQEVSLEFFRMPFTSGFC